MALVQAAAAAAATVAGALYLEGRYFLKKDYEIWRRERASSAAYDEAVKKNRQSLYYLFESRALAPVNQNRECIWSRNGCYTWSQALIKVHQYGRWLISLGVNAGDYVAIYMINSPDFMFMWLGILAVGAAPAMINYNLGGEALVHVMRVSDARLAVVDGSEDALVGRVEERRGQIEELGTRIVLLNEDVRMEVYSGKVERVEDVYRDGVRWNWPIAMLFTSGTTGMPKGVDFTTERGYQRVENFAIFRPDDRFYNCMPLYHGTGGIMALVMMCQGITLCIGRRFSTTKFWSEVHDSRATWITYVGETARYLLAAPPSPLDRKHCLRAMYGNGLRPDVWRKFQERFGVAEVVEFFASSEGVFALQNHAKGRFLENAVGHYSGYARWRWRNTVVPILIDEESGTIVRNPRTGFASRQPFEKGGEIVVKVENTNAFAGYHGNESATNKKFERDVFKKGDLWYRTGDALRRDRDGRWFFLDRLGDTFRWKGENVSTAEVSEVLGKFPGVVEANVYGVSLPSHDGRAGCAAIYLDPVVKDTFDYAGFLRHAREHLPRYAVPLFLRIVKEMTPIHNNKQNKAPLRAQGVDPTQVHEDDKILWTSEKGKGDTYIDFHPDHWEELKLGKAML